VDQQTNPVRRETSPPHSDPHRSDHHREAVSFNHRFVDSSARIEANPMLFFGCYEWMCPMDNLFGSAASIPGFQMPTGSGYNVTWNEEWKGYNIRVPNGELLYVEFFFDEKTSNRTIEYFQENDTFEWRNANWRAISPEQLEHIGFSNINWKQDWISLYGKRIPLPRLTSWYGDSGKAYTYSGITSHPNEWNRGLLHIKEKIEHCSGVNFNSVLLNWYRDGEDHISWHSDDEKELGANPTIASANFGAERDFIIRRKDENSAKLVLPLKHGTLLVMKGELQHFWQHSIPKRKNVGHSRFNLTFRRIGV
jgi:alkylated DNA repair dioxygenase AlkB